MHWLAQSGITILIITFAISVFTLFSKKATTEIKSILVDIAFVLYVSGTLCMILYSILGCYA